jgi:cytochrome c-type biogenesis protein CcmH/NrfG
MRNLAGAQEQMASGVLPISNNSKTWMTPQAYVVAVICLLVGVAAGYLLRGSGSPATVPSVQAAQQMPGIMGAGMQPTPEQLRHMAEKQAEPLLAELKSKPNDATLLSNIGNIFYDAQQFKDAIDYYNRSLQAEPDNPGVRTDMGTAYFYLGNADRAIAEFNAALQRDPKHAQTLFDLGLVKWQGKSDVTGAVEAWETLLRVVPDYPERERVEQLIARAKQHVNLVPAAQNGKLAGM